MQYVTRSKRKISRNKDKVSSSFRETESNKDNKNGMLGDPQVHLSDIVNKVSLSFNDAVLLKVKRRHELIELSIYLSNDTKKATNIGFL